MTNSTDFAKLLLRLTCGGILLFHGTHKVIGGKPAFQHVVDMTVNAGLPAWAAYGNYIGEFIAPIFVLLGYKTRIAAAVIAFNMFMTVAIAHRDIAFSVNDFGGWMIETNVLYMMTAVVLVFAGAGRYSVSGGKGKWD